MQITINGDRYEWTEPEISHEQICELANQPVYASVVYSGPRNGDSQRSGMTYKGKSIKVEDGLRIDAVVTGSA